MNSAVLELEEHEQRKRMLASTSAALKVWRAAQW